MRGGSTHVYMPSPSHPMAIFHSRSHCGAELIHKLGFPPQPPTAPPTSCCPRSLRFPEARHGSLSAAAYHLVPKDGWWISPGCCESPCLLEARDLSRRRPNQELLLRRVQPITSPPEPRIAAPLLLTIVSKGSLNASYMLSSYTIPWVPCLTKVVFVLSNSKRAG